MRTAELHEMSLYRLASEFPDNNAAKTILRDAAAFIRAQDEALNPPPPEPSGPLTYRSQ